MSIVHISVVSPVYGCCESLTQLYERLKETLSTITEDFEIILVNDSSPDDSWHVIMELAENDKRVKGINLSRNFGQHYAITAGLDYAQGNWVVVMDCDLQDKPEEIVKLYNKALEGNDIVFGRRYQRQDNIFRKSVSNLYRKIFDYFTEVRTDNSIANYSIISKVVVSKIRQLKEQNRSYPIFVNWLGFKRAEINIEHSEREFGKSSYTFKKLIILAVDCIVSQSNKPLRLSIQFGFLLSFFSMLYACWLVFRYFAFGISVEGWTSVMVSMYLLAGLLFCNLGFLGLYIGKIFNEVKNRPLYVIQGMINLK